MKSEWIRVGVAGGVLAVLLIAFVALPLAADSGDRQDSFSAYDGEWRGASEARRIIGEQKGIDTGNVGSSPLILKDVDPAATMLVIAGMDNPYSDAEEDAVDDFMRKGGTVVLLDDYGYGDTLANGYDIFYKKRPLRDSFFERNQSFVRVAGLVGEKSYPLLLNDPTALQEPNGTAGAEITPIIVSSIESFLDLNEDGVVDVIDTQGPFPVGLSRSVDRGRLVVVSDSGFLNNDMIGRQSNLDFITAMVQEALPSGGLVIFDESRRSTAGFEAPLYGTEKSILALFRAVPFAGIVFTAGVLVVTVTFLVRLQGKESWQHLFRPRQLVPPPHRPDRETLLRAILEKKADMDSSSDALVANALEQESRIRDEDAEVLMEHIARSLAIEMPAPRSDKDETSTANDDTPSPSPPANPTPS